MTITEHDGKQWAPIAELRNWDKNPRQLSDHAYVRLKAQVQRFGQYKPMLVTNDGIVLGGNMRLRAYRELGITQCWVSPVAPKDEKEMAAYAISDNDHVGQYVAHELAELVSLWNEEELGMFSADLTEGKALKELLGDFSPSGNGDDHPRLDKFTGEKEVTCPKCGHTFPTSTSD
ncbi:MAG: ParB N-terminal domain-containing protein [Parcubacteria group bacterium]|nr:ParB N-terminal domain-containing protein [Parcubacteria group bacterium]